MTAPDVIVDVPRCADCGSELVWVSCLECMDVPPDPLPEMGRQCISCGGSEGHFGCVVCEDTDDDEPGEEEA